MQSWWQRQCPELDDTAVKKSLYNRLKYALPKSSPPQRRRFELYHEIYRAQIPSLPALLPEVWLHWDHKTVRERGARALLGQRMDFLLLAPNHHRIVLEVDGESHYTDTAGRPSPNRYARNTALDRDLQLCGYTVYRFGGAELSEGRDPTPMLTQFFGRMFDRHGVFT